MRFLFQKNIFVSSTLVELNNHRNVFKDRNQGSKPEEHFLAGKELLLVHVGSLRHDKSFFAFSGNS